MADRKAATSKTTKATKATKAKAPAEKPMTKTDIFKKLAQQSGLEPKQVASVFAALEELALAELKKKNGAEQFVIPNLIKLKLVKKPATPAGMRKNPFKPDEMMEVKAKPATVKVKPVLLKTLKELGK